MIEHVESRKEGLEEEIQEHLHESLANARDSMELIQENIAPKVEKAIHTKMEEIDRKMRRLNEDSLDAVREELEKATPEISETILADLDKLVAENTRFVKMEILNEVKENSIEIRERKASSAATIDGLNKRRLDLLERIENELNLNENNILEFSNLELNEEFPDAVTQEELLDKKKRYR